MVSLSLGTMEIEVQGSLRAAGFLRPGCLFENSFYFLPCNPPVCCCTPSEGSEWRLELLWHSKPLDFVKTWFPKNLFCWLVGFCFTHLQIKSFKTPRNRNSWWNSVSFILRTAVDSKVCTLHKGQKPGVRRAKVQWRCQPSSSEPVGFGFSLLATLCTTRGGTSSKFTSGQLEPSLPGASVEIRCHTLYMTLFRLLFLHPPSIVTKSLLLPSLIQSPNNVPFIAKSTPLSKYHW